MQLILIPFLIIALIFGIYYRDNIWERIDLSVPSLGEDGFHVRQFFGSPPSPDSPLRQIKN